MKLLSLVLALFAANGNACANVLQRKAALQEPEDEPFSLRLLLSLIRRSTWLWGFVALASSFVLQAIALSIGELSAVEPVIAMELPLTLLVASWVFRVRLGRSEWGPTLAMTMGLVLLVAAMSPHGGAPTAVSHVTYFFAVIATIGLIAVLYLGGQRGTRATRTVSLGAAAGTAFGFTASLVKEVVSELSDHGIVGMLTTWQTYGAVCFGLLGMVLVQNALHVGSLVAAQPGITIMDPIVSILWGVLVYNEAIRTEWYFLLLAALGMTVIGVSAVALSHSPVLASPEQAAEERRLGRVGQPAPSEG